MPTTLFPVIPIIIIFLSTNRFHYAQSSSVAGTETLLGITGRDFIILGADSSTTSNIALTASNLDKIFVVTDPLTPYHPTPEDGIINDNQSQKYSDSFIRRRRQQAAIRQQRRQHAIVAAAAGDAADADKLLNLLSAHATVREYEVGVGCDVECVFDGGIIPTVVASPAGLDAVAVANLARGEISSSLRSRAPLRVCLLVAGMVWCDDRSDTEDIGGGAVTMDLDLDDEWDGSVVEEGSSSFSRRIQMQVEAAMEDFTSQTKGNKAIEKRKAVKTKPSVKAKRQPTAGHSLRPRLFWLDEYGSLQNVDYGAHGFAANFALSILDQGYRVDMTRDEAVELIRDCFEQLRERYVINSPRPPCIKCVDANGCSIVL